MTEFIVRVLSVHLINEQYQMDADPQTKPTDFACRMLSSTLHLLSPFNITSLHSWYSFYHTTEVRRLYWPRLHTCNVQLIPKAVCNAVIYVVTQLPTVGFHPLISHHSQPCYYLIIASSSISCKNTCTK